jgi:asparagine synthase (glutamine-hydrolysing)
MCGICGIWAYGSTNLPAVEVVAAMRDTMAHRGPDDTGLYVSPDRRIALGHRRLSIVDLSRAGHQPMSNEDGSIWIVYNGEIYNHVEIRQRLEARHTYKSRSDTETLIHLYEELGEGMLKELNGMFAFAIWDSRRNIIFAARDRIGIKPLYYTQADGNFAFASEIKALLRWGQTAPDIDDAALYHYLTFMATPAPMTLFKNVFKLPAGHTLTVEADGVPRVERWWDPIVGQRSTAAVPSIDESAERVRVLLEDSVRARLMADVPFGVFLSGGVDSSALTAIARKVHSGPLRTFSIGFEGAPDLDETQYAREMAIRCDTEHHEMRITPSEAISYLPKLVLAQDEPIADTTCVPLHFVSQLMRESGTVVGLTGEGSDEQFAGYRHYYRYAGISRLWSTYNALPRAIRATVAAVVVPLLERHGAAREVPELFRRAAADEPLFVSGAVGAWEREKRRLASPQQRRAWGGLSSVRLADVAATRLREYDSTADFVTAMVYQEFNIRLPELLLMRVDKITMSNSIEARVPFLDHRLVEYTFTLPTDVRMGGGTPKAVLKRAVRDWLPPNTLLRPKMGFTMPVKEWLRGPLASFARESIMESRFRQRGFLDYQAVDRVLAGHVSGHVNADSLVWSLLNVSLWYDAWVG